MKIMETDTLWHMQFRTNQYQVIHVNAPFPFPSHPRFELDDRGNEQLT